MSDQDPIFNPQGQPETPSAEQMSQPPIATETFGNVQQLPVVGEMAKKSEAARLESLRLRRMGVVETEDGVRGINVKPDAQHNPEPLQPPHKASPLAQEYVGEYIFQDGSTMPSVSLNAPSEDPKPDEPASTPLTPAVAFPPASSKKK